MTGTISRADRDDLRAGRRIIYLHDRRHVFPSATTGAMMEYVAGLVDLAVGVTVNAFEVRDVDVRRTGQQARWLARCDAKGGCPTARAVRVRPIRAAPPAEHSFGTQRELVEFMLRHRDDHSPVMVEQARTSWPSARIVGGTLVVELPAHVERDPSLYPRTVVEDVKVSTWQADIVATVAAAAAVERGRINERPVAPGEVADAVRRSLERFSDSRLTDVHRRV